MATPFLTFTGSNTSTLTGALLAANSGVTVSSIVLNASAQTAVNFYDGSLSPLGIGAGLLLTSGTMPGTANTVGWFGTDNSYSSGFDNGDADINAVVNTVFQTQSYDATTLSFDFTVADPTATSISFDLVFGSDEYPEWVDAFVDSAIVMVNGVNYALFNHDPNHPLSVVSANLTAGYFQDNANNAFPIEYDGVSHVLKIVAPINSGVTNHIKIGIADTGDHIYDSGIFISNLSAGNIPGSGVVITTPNSGTDNSDSITGTSKDEYFDLKAGNDTCYAGAGDDIIVAGAGNDAVYGGSGNDEMKGDGGDDVLDGSDGLSDTAVYAGNSAEYTVVFNAIDGSYTISDKKTSSASEGKDTLLGVELAKFNDGLFALTPSGLSSVTNPNQPPTNTPGSVIISGIGSAGNILTATVSDPDGLSGAVSYQWQASSDNGASWSNIGNDSNSYTVAAADVGTMVQVVASYTDNGSKAETPISAPKAILQTNNGDLVVTLMQLKAPSGTSTINPLTTLIQDAIDLGLSPNLAALSVKNVLGIPAAVNLQTYDAYAALQTNPSNQTALLVEKVAVEVAILTSLSDDDTGMNLTSAIVTAAANSQVLDLANANDLADILGVDITGLTKANYPEPLKTIFDRNSSMSSAIADGGDVSDIEKEWQDLLSIKDGINSTSIADLSIHVNQAPTGSATAALAEGKEGFAYTLTAADLLAGFSDSDGGVLSVTDLSANIAGSLTDNKDGTWTFTPDANYTGPVELTYKVNDGQGGSTSASQLFVIATGNQAPTSLSLSSTSIDENVPANSIIGTLSSIDPDSGDSFTYSLVSGAGSTNNNSFTIVNNELHLKVSPNFETKASYSVRVRTTDAGGLFTESPFTITINNLLTNPITGTAANETFTATNEIDIIDASGGNDILSVTVPNLQSGDTFDGNTEIDSFRLSQGSLTDEVTLDLSAANQFVSLTGVSGITLTNVENLNIAAFKGKGNLTGDGNANIFTGGVGNDTLNGGDGNDKLNGGAGSDNVSGGAGNDTITAAFNQIANGESLDGGTYLDTLVLTNGTSSDSIALNLSQANQLVNISSGISANITNVEVFNVAGFLGNSSLTGDDNANSFTGGVGNDTLTGGAGNDKLSGGAGNDSLVGGTGKDTLTGGTGNDRFDYQTLTDSLLANYDLIKDFNANEDKFLVTTAPTVFTQGVTVTALTQAGIGAKLTTTNFVDAQYVAKFSYGTRTFVAINDSVAGFQANKDAIVELTTSGITGTLELGNFVIA